MSYGAKYIMQAYDRRGTLVLATILQKGYSGSSQVIDGGVPPLKITWDTSEDNKNDTIKGSSCTITLNCPGNMFFYDLYTSDPTQFMVKVEINSILVWLGYLLPEQYSEPYAAAEAGYFVDIVATDRLAALKDLDYLNGASNYTGRVLIMDVLRNILDKIALWNNTGSGQYIIGLNLLETHNTDSDSTNALIQNYEYNEKYLNDDGTPWKCWDVLSNIMKEFGCRILQYAGNWHITRIGELTAAIKRQTYTYTGTFSSADTWDPNLVITGNNEAESTRLIWMGDASLIMLPPWKGFNFIQKLFSKPDITGDGAFAKWLAGDHSIWDTNGGNFSSYYSSEAGATVLGCNCENVGAWGDYISNVVLPAKISGTTHRNLVVDLEFSSQTMAMNFQFEIRSAGWWLKADGTWQNSLAYINYSTASGDKLQSHKIESNNIPVSANQDLYIIIYNPQRNGGGMAYFKSVNTYFVNPITHLIQGDITTPVSINANYQQSGPDWEVTGGDGNNLGDDNNELFGALAYQSAANYPTWLWGPRGGTKNDRLLNFIKTDLINLFKLPTKKLNGKLETSILSPLNTIREPWCDNAIFMMHRMDWNPVDNEIDVEIVELFTSSFFLLEDGSGYYLMEDGVSHYNY